MAITFATEEKWFMLDSIKAKQAAYVQSRAELVQRQADLQQQLQATVNQIVAHDGAIHVLNELLAAEAPVAPPPVDDAR